MIKRYSDHAANERTFLAWVRTAIAIMAFGFVIERFDLFLQMLAPQMAQQHFTPHGQWFANMAGLAFIVLGVAMIAIAGCPVRSKLPRTSRSRPTCRAPANVSILRLPC